MGRWRPPPQKSSPYITAEGAAALKTELAELWKLRRSDVVPALSAAAAEGDRSENAEYIYRKKQLAQIDRKIHYLSKRLEVIKIVDRAPERRDRVFFGAFIEVADEQGLRRKYRIVGADETDAKRGFISVDSPFARAMLGKDLGAAVTVELPTGPEVFTVIQVRYEVEPG